MQDQEQGPLASLLFNLQATLGDLKVSMAQQAAAQRASALAQRTPFFARLQGSVLVPASGLAVVVLAGGGAGGGGPATGYYWNVRRLVIGGTDPSQTAAGRADVFTTPQDIRSISSRTQTSIMGWADFTSSMPSVAFYGIGEMRVNADEGLFIVLSGATNGQMYAAEASVQIVQESAASQDIQT